MNKINIETYENEKKANYKIYIDEKLELEVKGFRYKNTNELMDWISRSYERYISTLQPTTTVNMGGAKFAGYYEVAQAIEMLPDNQPFTTRDIARNIVDEVSPKFRQTHANISADLSAFKEPEDYPDWLEVVGMKGRAREYKKTRDVSAKEIENDLRKAAKKAWS